MVNKTKGTNANLTANSVTINGVAYPLTATITATNTGRLNPKNAYIVNSVYNGATVANITRPKANPSAKVNSALSNANLAKNNISLGSSASTVLSRTGLGYFLKAGNITIS
jgi:hypothetical protein